MKNITSGYGRDLDLNLLRVFIAVADARSVTKAAQQLYLTQPAVSAALRRLTAAVRAPLFARSGRGLVLTARGARLLEQTRAPLLTLLSAALEPPRFDPKTSEHVVRLGLADSFEQWLVPRLLRVLSQRAPRMRLVVTSLSFRTVGDALASRSIDAAVTVADELPSSVRRLELFHGGFVCLFDPRHARVRGRLEEVTYFAHEHVIVSYNADLRGVVEDLMHKQRNVRCSLSSFAQLGAVVDGSALLATVPALVAEDIRATRPHLRTAKLPLPHYGAPTELLWPIALDDDEPARFVREQLVRIVKKRRLAKRERGGAVRSRSVDP